MSDAAKFKPGDLVVLKSGSQRMVVYKTITPFAADGTGQFWYRVGWLCQYTGKPRAYDYPEIALLTFEEAAQHDLKMAESLGLRPMMPRN